MNSSYVEDIPENSYLGESYPNPFNISVNIPIYLERNSDVQINIFNLLGKKIFSTKNSLNPGRNIINWSGQTNEGHTFLPEYIL